MIAAGEGLEEARRLGVRTTVLRGSMNLSERDGGLPPDTVVQDEDALRKLA